jgi:hypothetical protein
MRKKPNADLQDIEAAGFMVEIRSGKNGFAKAYLAHKSGFRSQTAVRFPDNKRSNVHITASMRVALASEHVGVALEKLRKEHMPFVTTEFADWEALKMLQAIESDSDDQARAPAPRLNTGRL